MYINNINNADIKRPFSEIRLEKGSIIGGKILNTEDGSFELQLYDGTAIPVTIEGNNNIADRTFNRFYIKDFNGNNFILIPIDNSKDTVLDNSIMDFFKTESIPEDTGNEIINSLLKFNLPANDKNIMTLYKNISFFNDIKSMSDTDIEKFIQNNTSEHLNHNSIELSAGKDFFNILKSVDMDTISFFIENDISLNIKNIISFGEFARNKFYLNNLIDKFRNMLTDTKDLKMSYFDNSNKIINSNVNNNSLSDTDIGKIKNALQVLYDSFADNIDGNNLEGTLENTANFKQTSDIVKSLISELEAGTKHSDVVANKIINKLVLLKLADAKNIVSLKDVFKSSNLNDKNLKLSSGDIDKLNSLLQLSKGIENNYSVFSFNYYMNEKCYESNVVFKKHNKSKYINPSDVKFYISVKTHNIGDVESFIVKKDNNIDITMKSEKKYMPVFKSTYNILGDNLLKLGYNLTRFNVCPINSESNTADIFNFFNDTTYKKLDVKV